MLKEVKMGYSVYGERCLGIMLDDVYFEALKEDLKLYEELSEERKREFILGLNAEQRSEFERLLAWKENNPLEMDFFYEDFICANKLNVYNNGYRCPIDIKTGNLQFDSGEMVEGWLFIIDNNFSNIYSPLFKDATDLLNYIKECLYIPRKYCVEKNISLITYVWDD